MTIQINPSKIPIWVGEDSLQLGLDDNSQTLDDLTHAQERLVHLLFKPVPDNQLEFLGESVGLEKPETLAFIERLRPSLLAATKNSEQITLDLRFAELMRIAFDTGQVAETVLTIRSKKPVVLEKLNRTGLLLLRSLSEMGFRNFFTADYSSVSRSDTGELGYPVRALGISRATAVRELLGDFGTLNFKSKKQEQELHLLSSNHSISPDRYRERRGPHLVIEYGIESIEISSMIIPGSSACISCRDLWRSEVDPNWCNRSIQLAMRRDHLDDSASLLLATALAAKNICGFTDEGSPGQAFEVRLKSRDFQALSHKRHPACECARLETQNF